MRLLLDTHALLWWLTYDRRLGPTARDLIEDPHNDVLVSVVALWEIALKVRVGKLKADLEQVTGLIQQEGCIVLDIGIKHLQALARLPAHHRDPFDHLLIAQAIAEDAVFMSENRNAWRYPARLVGCSGSASPVANPGAAARRAT